MREEKEREEKGNSEKKERKGITRKQKNKKAHKYGGLRAGQIEN